MWNMSCLHFLLLCTHVTISGRRWFLFSLVTLNTLTSPLLLISSTRASGFPLGTGIVPRIMVPGVDSVWWTAWMKGWLKSSIFPISSMTHTLCPGPLLELALFKTGSANCSKEVRSTTYWPTRHSRFPGGGSNLKEKTLYSSWKTPTLMIGVSCSAEPLAWCLCYVILNNHLY